MAYVTKQITYNSCPVVAKSSSSDKSFSLLEKSLRLPCSPSYILKQIKLVYKQKKLLYLWEHYVLGQTTTVVWAFTFFAIKKC